MDSTKNSNPKTISDLLVATLADCGVKRMYAITGDSLNAVNSSVRQDGRINWIHVRHEESGAFAAGAEAQLSGELACCAGSSGPGHVHLVNGLYDCQRSYAPVFAIASTCASTQFGMQYFQETDTDKLFADCSGHNVIADTAVQAQRMLHESLQYCMSHNEVAVYGLPGDVAQQTVSDNVPSNPGPQLSEKRIVPSEQDVKEVADILNKATRITLYCGTGVRFAHDEMVALSNKLNAPVASTLKGKMFVLYDCPNAISCAGAVGTQAGWDAVHDCDVLVMLGNDFPFDYMMPKGKTVVQVDCRATHIGRRIPVTKGVCADTKVFLEMLLPMIEQKTDRSFLDEMKADLKKSTDDIMARAAEKGKVGNIGPEYVTTVLDRLAAQDALFTVDTGLNCVWAGHYLTPTKDREMIGSFNHGSMANAMPQAMGLQLVYPGRQVIGLCGDGGVTMLMGDLLTIVTYKLPVKLIVYNNRTLGYVQMEMEADDIPVWQTDLDNPNLGKIASDMGFLGITVTDPDDVEDAIKKALAHPGPALVDITTAHRDMPELPDMKFTFTF